MMILTPWLAREQEDPKKGNLSLSSMIPRPEAVTSSASVESKGEGGEGDGGGLDPIEPGMRAL